VPEKDSDKTYRRKGQRRNCWWYWCWWRSAAYVRDDNGHRSRYIRLL